MTQYECFASLERLLTDWHVVSMDFVGSNKFPISLNGGGSESKALDCWLITGADGITGWSSSSSSLLTECSCVTCTRL